jgi:hypothetical protein
MSVRPTDLWLSQIPHQAGLELSLNTGLFSASAAGFGIAYTPAAFGSDPSRQSHERWLYP